jgi:hypothetical protein
VPLTCELPEGAAFRVPGQGSRPVHPALVGVPPGGSIVIRRVPHFECITDTALGGKVLHYGKSVRLGKLRCTSRRNGMHCKNRATGHGFRLSRASYTIF